MKDIRADTIRTIKDMVEDILTVYDNVPAANDYERGRVAAYHNVLSMINQYLGETP